MKPSDFEPLLQIDKFDLDEEISKQPDLIHRVSEALALAISRRDEAKTTLAEIEAELELEFRDEGKSTDKTIAARVRAHKETKEATRALRKAQHTVNRWSALEKGVAARGHALREMAKLYVNEYYSTQGGVRAGSSMKDVTADRARKAMHGKRQAKQDWLLTRKGKQSGKGEKEDVDDR
jgi:hypothetical protein